MKRPWRSGLSHVYVTIAGGVCLVVSSRLRFVLLSRRSLVPCVTYVTSRWCWDKGNVGVVRIV